MRRLALIALVAGCQAAPTGGLALPVPAKLQSALAMFTDLHAEAVLVPKGGSPKPGIALARSDDATSFSGFIEATPGDYTLEVVFGGKHENVERFLGRLRSDAFTVLDGRAVDASFSQPVDAIGRPEDHGDDDMDGVGVLDELLWDTKVDDADSDDDGLDDRVDCDPNDGESKFAIVAAGSREDCDGDRVRRIDVPFGTAGEDCDDERADVRPGATDDCTDMLDADCNPQTCPISDDSRPMIDRIDPPAGARVGCHRKIRARVRDESRVSAVYLAFPDDPTMFGERLLTMTRLASGGDIWESVEINSAAALKFNHTGETTIEIRATDDRGNTAIATQKVFLAFTPPTVSFSPDTLGAKPNAFDIDVDATVPEGAGSITLYAVPQTGDSGSYPLEDRVRVGSSSTASARFTVDPSKLSVVPHLLYAEVVDAVGNQLRPYAVSPLYAQIANSSDYLCLGSPYPSVPAIPFIPGRSEYTPSKMRELLPDALQAASARDPQAALVEIQASAIGADGVVPLDRQSSLPRWGFTFWNPGTELGFTVSWHAPPLRVVYGPNPVFADATPSNKTPFTDRNGLSDSDTVMAAFAISPGCAPVGAETDFLQYSHNDNYMKDVVFVGTLTDTWFADAIDPRDIVLMCSP